MVGRSSGRQTEVQRHVLQVNRSHNKILSIRNVQLDKRRGIYCVKNCMGVYCVKTYSEGEAWVGGGM